MASSNKTPALQLNSWVGSDIPKMEDFNSDNTLLDAAIAALRETVDTLEQGGGTPSEGGGNDPRLDAHLADMQAHLAAADRVILESAAPVIGGYTGNGNVFQGVTLGFRPSYGIAFAVGLPTAKLTATGDALFAHFAIISPSGCSSGAEITPLGFNAYQLGAASSTGQTSAGLNAQGQLYAYIVWK